MFGYVRPLVATLSEEATTLYRAAYCGLCHTIGKRYGFIAQLFLNYDFAFLAMVLAGEGERGCIRCRRCAVFVTRKRDTWEQNPSLELAADESVILAYWKLKDGMEDRGFWKGIPLRFAAAGLWFSYRKARKYCPNFDVTVRQCLTELRKLEQEGCPYLDRPADAFARILQAASGVDGQAGQHALSQLLYHVGRWIYLIDAWDDLEEDRKQGSYNPMLAQYGTLAQEQMKSVRQTLYASLGTAAQAAEWLEFGMWDPIVDNIITLGLPAVEEAVLSGLWKSNKKQIIRRSGDE